MASGRLDRWPCSWPSGGAPGCWPRCGVRNSRGARPRRCRGEPHREDAFLARLLRAVTAMHQPLERRLDPRHPVERERCHEPAGSQRRIHNSRRVRLIDDDCLGVVVGANLALNRHATHPADPRRDSVSASAQPGSDADDPGVLAAQEVVEVGDTARLRRLDLPGHQLVVRRPLHRAEDTDSGTGQ